MEEHKHKYKIHHDLSVKIDLEFLVDNHYDNDERFIQGIIEDDLYDFLCNAYFSSHDGSDIPIVSVKIKTKKFTMKSEDVEVGNKE